ncbi:tetratricopeptide repeat protein [bacterium]|nr:tetratricopeptide repeat protein [bacterium]
MKRDFPKLTMSGRTTLGCLLLLVASACFAEPSSLTGSHDLARQYVAEGEYEEAISLYEAVYRQNPSDSRSRNNLGLVYALTGQAEESLRLLDVNRKQYPASAVAHQNYAVAALFDGRTTESLQSLRQALILAPESAPIRRNAAIALMATGLTEEAIQQYELVASQRPNDLNDQLVYASLLLKTQRFSDARDKADAILLKEPAQPVALRIRELAMRRTASVQVDLRVYREKRRKETQKHILIALLQ